MQKKLTVTIDAQVYEGLYRTIGPRKISKFIEELVRPHVVRPNLESAYAEMAKDRKREREALEWAEVTFKDADHREDTPPGSRCTVRGTESDAAPIPCGVSLPDAEGLGQRFLCLDQPAALGAGKRGNAVRAGD